MASPWGKPRRWDLEATNLVHRGTGISTFCGSHNRIPDNKTAVKYRPGDWRASSSNNSSHYGTLPRRNTSYQRPSVIPTFTDREPLTRSSSTTVLPRSSSSTLPRSYSTTNVSRPNPSKGLSRSASVSQPPAVHPAVQRIKPALARSNSATFSPGISRSNSSQGLNRSSSNDFSRGIPRLSRSSSTSSPGLYRSNSTTNVTRKASNSSIPVKKSQTKRRPPPVSIKNMNVRANQVVFSKPKSQVNAPRLSRSQSAGGVNKAPKVRYVNGFPIVVSDSEDNSDPYSRSFSYSKSTSSTTYSNPKRQTVRRSNSYSVGSNRGSALSYRSRSDPPSSSSRRSPEPRRRRSEPPRRSPEPRRRSPEPRRRSPEPRRRSPEPRRRSSLKRNSSLYNNDEQRSVSIMEHPSEIYDDSTYQDRSYMYNYGDMDDDTEVFFNSDDNSFGSLQSSEFDSDQLNSQDEQLSYKQLRKRRMLNSDVKFPRTRPMSPGRRESLAQLHQITFDIERPPTSKELCKFYQDTRMVPKPHLALSLNDGDRRKGDTPKFNSSRRHSNIPVKNKYRLSNSSGYYSSSEDSLSSISMTFSEYEAGKRRGRDRTIQQGTTNSYSNHQMSNNSTSHTLNDGLANCQLKVTISSFDSSPEDSTTPFPESISEYVTKGAHNHLNGDIERAQIPPNQSDNIIAENNNNLSINNSVSEDNKTMSESLSSNEQCLIEELENLILTQEHLLLDSENKDNSAEEKEVLDDKCSSLFVEKHEQLISDSELGGDFKLLSTTSGSASSSLPLSRSSSSSSSSTQCSDTETIPTVPHSETADHQNLDLLPENDVNLPKEEFASHNEVVAPVEHVHSFSSNDNSNFDDHGGTGFSTDENCSENSLHVEDSGNVQTLDLLPENDVNLAKGNDSQDEEPRQAEHNDSSVLDDYKLLTLAGSAIDETVSPPLQVEKSQAEETGNQSVDLLRLRSDSEVTVTNSDNMHYRRSVSPTVEVMKEQEPQTVKESSWLSPDIDMNGNDNCHVRSESYITAVEENSLIKEDPLYEETSKLTSNGKINLLDDLHKISGSSNDDSSAEEKSSRSRSSSTASRKSVTDIWLKRTQSSSEEKPLEIPRPTSRSNGKTHVTDIWLKRSGSSTDENASDSSRTRSKSSITVSRSNSNSSRFRTRSNSEFVENLFKRRPISPIMTNIRPIRTSFSSQTMKLLRNRAKSQPNNNTNSDTTMSSISSTIGNILEKSNAMSSGITYADESASSQSESDEYESVKSSINSGTNEANPAPVSTSRVVGQKERTETYYKTVVVSSDSEAADVSSSTASNSSSSSSTRSSKSAMSLIDSLLESWSSYTST